LAVEFSIVVTEEGRRADQQAIADLLYEYNRQNAQPANFKPLALLVKAPDGSTLGGLWGNSAYEWLFVEFLFVPEPLRGTGLGRSLMLKAEQIAKDRGCLGVWLDTFAFQARAFYEKLGYTVFGELKDHPRGISQYWLQKRLD
jgi:GNAT superfamily N-acetyltransferase